MGDSRTCSHVPNVPRQCTATIIPSGRIAWKGSGSAELETKLFACKIDDDPTCPNAGQMKRLDLKSSNVPTTMR